MVWDGFDAEKYETWFKTPAGQFALEQEFGLMDHLISGWPRRKRKLLEVGCGTGLSLIICTAAVSMSAELIILR